MREYEQVEQEKRRAKADELEKEHDPKKETEEQVCVNDGEIIIVSLGYIF